MNKILSLTILSLAFAVGFGADTDKQLPKAASDVVAELNASKTLATQKAIKKLQVVLSDLTKKGDLDGANLTKSVIDGLQKGLDDNKTVATTEPSDIAHQLIGKWSLHYSNGTVASILIQIKGSDILVSRVSGYGSGSYLCKWDDSVKSFVGVGFDGSKIEQYSVLDGKVSAKHIADAGKTIIAIDCVFIK